MFPILPPDQSTNRRHTTKWIHAFVYSFIHSFCPLMLETSYHTYIGNIHASTKIFVRKLPPLAIYLMISTNRNCLMDFPFSFRRHSFAFIYRFFCIQLPWQYNHTTSIFTVYAVIWLYLLRLSLFSSLFRFFLLHRSRFFFALSVTFSLPCIYMVSHHRWSISRTFSSTQSTNFSILKVFHQRICTFWPYEWGT